MPKTFYTERDIQDLAAKGVDSLRVDENTVLTELAREAARKHGIKLQEGKERPSGTPQPKPKTKEAQAEPPSGGELEQRVYSSVKKRLGDQVDENLLKAIVQRVLKNVGGK